jgi:hypothetical protein
LLRIHAPDFLETWLKVEEKKWHKRGSNSSHDASVPQALSGDSQIIFSLLPPCPNSNPISTAVCPTDHWKFQNPFSNSHGVDLYGNEDGDLTGTGAQDLSKTQSNEPESSLAESKPNGTSKPAEKSQLISSKPSAHQTTAPTGAPIQSYTTPLPNDTTPSYAPQHIPTYQQPANYESQAVSPPLEDGTYANGERMIRPSEMKDEG